MCNSHKKWLCWSCFLSYVWISLKIAMLTPYNSLWVFPIILEFVSHKSLWAKNLDMCTLHHLHWHIISFEMWNIWIRFISKVLLSTTSNYRKCITKHESPTTNKKSH
jgi:fucose 4-O-acetylase-like acetyltransferase